jgi:hypothetical protein
MPNDADRAGTPAGVFGAETGERPPAEDFPPRLDAVPGLDTRGALTLPVGPPEEGPQAAPVRLVPGVGRHRSPGHGPEVIRAAHRAGALANRGLCASDPQCPPGWELVRSGRTGSRAAGPPEHLDRTGAPQLWCILDEGVLHRPIGGSKIMRSQLYRLAEVAEHPKTTIQVIPFGGAHAGLLGGFVIADLDGKPSMAYLETGERAATAATTAATVSKSAPPAQP